MKFGMKVLGTLVMLAVTACGGDASSGEDPAPATTFTCYGSSAGCTSGTEYCLTTTKNGVTMTGFCAKLASSCTNCGCATSQAPSDYSAANPTSDNCSGATVTCSQSDAEIRVVCKK